MQKQTLAIQLCVVLMVTAPAETLAFDLPASADGARREVIAPPPVEEPAVQAAPVIPVIEEGATQAPKGADGIEFTLKRVNLLGVSKRFVEEIHEMYTSLYGEKVTLEFPWILAHDITEYYRAAGYFLTRAYVPAQTVEDGIFTIRVAEGFVETVSVDAADAALPVVRAWVDKIKSYRPLTVKQLEEAMLELNSLPKRKFRAVLDTPSERVGEDGATVLNLISEPDIQQRFIRLDNTGSRYLGPYQAQVQYDTMLIDGQWTRFSGLVSLPTDELQSLSLRHIIPLYPRLAMDMAVSYTSAYPGYSLEIQDIESDTFSVASGLTYYWRRQRDEILTSRLGIEARQTSADILDTPLSRDRLRMVQFDTTYAAPDSYWGYSTISGTITQGLPVAGASNAGAANLSRAEAEPDFTSLRVAAGRLQGVDDDVQAYLALEGQYASKPLYSSEEFGYGGAQFGRAYDNSEITGDHGVRAAIELRYTGWQDADGVSATPYIFYDIGKVWNKDRAQLPHESASSAGAGVRFNTEAGVSAGVGVAVPLTRKADQPTQGGNGSSPRVIMDVQYAF
jgi:hemolysin activation/secretion protein